MKKIVFTICFAVAMVACNNKPADPPAVDTMAIKQQAVAEEQARAQAQAQARSQAQADENARIAAAERRGERRAEQTDEQSPAPQQQAPVKKGWSSAAKGTLIGAGAGAVAGALIDKNHAQGALIGGVLGGGTGYVVGRGKDRKTGRVVKKPDDQ